MPSNHFVLKSDHPIPIPLFVHPKAVVMHPFYTRRFSTFWILAVLFLFSGFQPTLRASNGCSGPPVITCPPDYQGCPGDNISPTYTGTATATFPQDCWPPNIGYSDHIVSTGTCSGEKVIERTWRAVDPDDRAKRDSCVQIIRLEADGPSITCPADQTVTCESDITVHPSDATVDTDCSLGFSVNVTGPLVTGDPDCPGTIYEYKFTVTDDCGRTAFCKQRFTIHNAGPTIHCPADLTVDCPSDIDPHPSDATVSTSCQLGYQVAMEGPDIYGSGCSGKTYTYTFIITDNCGRKDSCMQVYTLNDTTPPVFTYVPPDEDVCGYAPPFGTPQVSDSCGNVHLTSYDRIIWGNCHQGEKKIRTWTATDECGNSSQATQTIIFNHDDHAPEFWDCPYDITVTANSGCEKAVYWTPPTATDNCGTPMITSNFHPGDIFPTGMTEVRYTARDACGNVSYCTFKVTVRGNSLQLYCPQDKYVTCDSRYDGAYVSWNPPHVTSSCYGGGCSGPAPYISGFIYMGEFNGSRYYCSNFRSSWGYAKQYCQSKGGHLAVVNDAQENSWIANQLQTSSAFIGLTDELQEGNWRWVNGEPVTYTNWIPGQPSNSNNDQHYVEMFGANSYYYGKWNDHYGHQSREFVMEVPCSDVDIIQTRGPANGSHFGPGTTQVCYEATDGRGYSTECCFDVHVHPSKLQCVDDIHVYCESGKNGAYVNWNPPSVNYCGEGCVDNQNIPGFIYMGTYDGHQYYCSNFVADWHQAKQYCIDNGGYLASINDQGENDFLAAQVAAPSAFIGMHDENQEGVWEWLNGDDVTYTNWIPGQPNNYNGAQHYVEMFGRNTSYSGKWNDQYSYEKREFIMELPCVSPYQYVGRPSGSWFEPGVHQIRYKLRDKYGYEQYCNFKVIVHCNNGGGGGNGSYCESKSRNDAYFWINEIRMGSIQNRSGKDGGYEDYTDKQTDVYRGHSYYIHLIPGFRNYNTRVYWRIWVDWNQDGDFGDYGELAGYAHSNLSVRGVITIPGNAVPGRTRMRISMNYADYPDPCETFYYGEVEDYSLYVHSYYTRETNDAQAEVGSVHLDTEDMEEARDFPKVYEIDNNRNWEVDTKLPPVVEGGTGEADLLLFPNPASDRLNIQLFDMPSANLMSIYNKLGQRIQSIQTDGSSHYELDISQLPAGVYYLMIDGDESDQLSRSFVIQR